MGGGRQCLQTINREKAPRDLDIWACARKDGRDLVQDWKDDKKSRNVTWQYLETNGDLKNLNVDSEYVMGA